MVIDFHTHCFPDNLAERALSSLRINMPAKEGIPTTLGTVSSNEAYMRENGVDKAVVCNVVTNTKQEHNVNSFAIEIAGKNSILIPFGSIHPSSENKEAELLRLKNAGIKGIKIHPDYIHTDINTDGYYELFDMCVKHDMTVISHTGFDPYSPEHIYADADAVADVIDNFPKLRFVAAHLGGLFRSEQVIKMLVGKNIWIDTALCAQRTDERDNLIKIIKSHDPDRILFGTDTPWSPVRLELDFLNGIGIDDRLKEKILWKNAIELLNKN